MPVFGLQKAEKYRVAGLLGGAGLLVSLCLILEENETAVKVFAPDHDPSIIRKMRIGDLCVGPESGKELQS